MANTYIQIRTDEEDKKEASEILNALGTNLSAVLNMTIKQIILKRGIPFDVALPEDCGVRSVSASMAMEGMPLDSKQKEELALFHRMSSYDQDEDIKRIVAEYAGKGAHLE